MLAGEPVSLQETDPLRDRVLAVTTEQGRASKDTRWLLGCDLRQPQTLTEETTHLVFDPLALLFSQLNLAWHGERAVGELRPSFFTVLLLLLPERRRISVVVLVSVLEREREREQDGIDCMAGVGISLCHHATRDGQPSVRYDAPL